MAHYSRQISPWEKLDLVLGACSIAKAAVVAAFTGPFRGESGASTLFLHVCYAVARTATSRLSTRQAQYLDPPTETVYNQVAKSNGFEPETVHLPHDATGHWIGNKDARFVMIYFPGGGCARPATPGHIQLCSRVVNKLDAAGCDVACFFVSYTLTPHGSYPTQIQQAVEALRYILETANRSASSVLLGGDALGGSFALATLLHMTHPHPQIDPLPHTVPLAGLFAIAPEVAPMQDLPSVKQNAAKDLVTASQCTVWTNDYLNNAPRDSYNELTTAPLEWWESARVHEMLILAGSDEIMLSSLQAFYAKVNSVFKKVSMVVGNREAHVAPVYNYLFGDKTETEQERELVSWLRNLLPAGR